MAAPCESVARRKCETLSEIPKHASMETPFSTFALSAHIFGTHNDSQLFPAQIKYMISASAIIAFPSVPEPNVESSAHVANFFSNAFSAHLAETCVPYVKSVSPTDKNKDNASRRESLYCAKPKFITCRLRHPWFSNKHPSAA